MLINLLSPGLSLTFTTFPNLFKSSSVDFVNISPHPRGLTLKRQAKTDFHTTADNRSTSIKRTHNEHEQHDLWAPLQGLQLQLYALLRVENASPHFPSASQPLSLPGPLLLLHQSLLFDLPTVNAAGVQSGHTPLDMASHLFGRSTHLACSFCSYQPWSHYYSFLQTASLH